MIDWVAVGFHALWIFGAALLLATVGYLRWLASEHGRPLRDLLSTPSWTLTVTAALLLVCIGIAGGIVERWWEKAIRIGLALGCAYQMTVAFRRRDKHARS